MSETLLGNLARELTTSFWNTTYFPKCLQALPLSPFRDEFCRNTIVRLLATYVSSVKTNWKRIYKAQPVL